MNRQLRCPSAVSLVVGFLLVYQAGLVAADPIEKLNSLLSGYDTIKGRFTLVTVSEEGEELETTENKIYLRRPDHFRFEKISPYEQIIISDGTTWWDYDPDLEQVIIRSYDREQLEQTPAVLLTGDIDGIRNNFAVEQLSEETFKLTPMNAGQNIEWLQIEFNKDLPRRITSFDSLGNVTTFTFSDLEINRSIDKSLFTFTTPDGIEEVYADGQ